MVPLGHDLSNLVLRARAEDASDTLRALLTLGAQAFGAILGLLAMADHVNSGFVCCDCGEQERYEGFHLCSRLCVWKCSEGLRRCVKSCHTSRYEKPNQMHSDP